MTPRISIPSSFSAGSALFARPNAAWGLHLTDANIALGNLVTVVRHQISAYMGK